MPLQQPPPHRSLNLTPPVPNALRLRTVTAVEGGVQRRDRLGGLIHEYNLVAQTDFAHPTSLTDQNRRVLLAGEKRLVVLPPGTPQGRTFKRAALRYLRESLRPPNRCLGDAVDAKTVRDSGASVTGYEAAKRKGATLSRALNAALEKMKATRRCTIRRP